MGPPVSGHGSSANVDGWPGGADGRTRSRCCRGDARKEVGSLTRIVLPPHRRLQPTAPGVIMKRRG